MYWLYRARACLPLAELQKPIGKWSARQLLINHMTKRKSEKDNMRGVQADIQGADRQGRQEIFWHDSEEGRLKKEWVFVQNMLTFECSLFWMSVWFSQYENGSLIKRQESTLKKKSKVGFRLYVQHSRAGQNERIEVAQKPPNAYWSCHNVTDI